MTLGETTAPPIRRARVGHRRPPIRRRLLHAEVGDRLRDMIVQGDIAAGGRLNEFRLAEMLHVSRTPIREALKSSRRRGWSSFCPGAARGSPDWRRKRSSSCSR